MRRCTRLGRLLQLTSSSSRNRHALRRHHLLDVRAFSRGPAFSTARPSTVLLPVRGLVGGRPCRATLTFQLRRAQEAAADEYARWSPYVGMRSSSMSRSCVLKITR